MSDYETDVLLWSERHSKLLRPRAAGELVNEADADWPIAVPDPLTTVEVFRPAPAALTAR